MEVSMDGLRKRLVKSYNSLVYRLNQGIEDDSVSVDKHEIEEHLDSIRNCIVTLAFTRMEGQWEEMHEDTEFLQFDPEED